MTTCSSMDFQGNAFKALIFEFMPNQSLEEWLHPQTGGYHGVRHLNFLERLNIAIDVTSGLDYLHNHCQPTVVHCDLKPNNVLLNDDMTAHATDLGSARILSTASYNCLESEDGCLVLEGTIGYIAPEYGIGGQVSVKGDVFSYGILLLEMFTGKKPTDDMFQDEQNLRNFAKMALSGQVMSIMDPRMDFEGDNQDIKTRNQVDRHIRMQECLVSAIKPGVTCSAESPTERLHMGEVVSELHRIRDSSRC